MHDLWKPVYALKGNGKEEDAWPACNWFFRKDKTICGFPLLVGAIELTREKVTGRSSPARAFMVCLNRSNTAEWSSSAVMYSTRIFLFSYWMTRNCLISCSCSNMPVKKWTMSGLFFGVKTMCELPVPQLLNSGLDILPNLTVADPYMALPIALCAAVNLQIHVSPLFMSCNQFPDVLV